MAARRDRLSDLPDDLLIHILSFAPAREAASTSALSRRWSRRLWLQTSAINLDHRSYPDSTAAAAVRRRAELEARHALAFHRHSSRKPATRKVTVVMRDAAATAMHDDILRAATVPCGCIKIHGEEDGVLEELRIDCARDGGRAPSSSSYALSLDSLPLRAAALRILDLKGCSVVSHNPYSWNSDGRRLVAFPCLEALRLRRCGVRLDAVQAMLDAAPKLAGLCIESCTLQWTTTMMVNGGAVLLRCPPATVSVVLADLDMAGSGSCASFFLDAPGLRRLRFARVDPAASAAVVFVHQFGGLDLDRVHLELHHARPLRAVDLRGLRRTRALKLTVYCTADLLDAAAGQSTPSVTFPALEQLDIEELTACGSPASRVAAVVSLLRRCPAVRELRLRSRWKDYLRETVPDPEIRAAAMADLSPCSRSINRDQDDEADCCCEDLGEFRCTGLDSLRRVAVDFDAEEPSYFHVRLLRFLAQNAAGLQEVVVAGNGGFDSSRIDRKVAAWMMQSRSRCPSPTLVEYSSCSCCGTAGGSSSSWAPAPECPVWPPFLIEFPPLEAPDLPNQPCSDGEDDNGDISPRHFMDVARKRGKNWSSPECFSLKLPKAKKGGLVVTAGRRRR